MGDCDLYAFGVAEEKRRHRERVVRVAAWVACVLLWMAVFTYAGVLIAFHWMR